jgi:hypothetical protein
MNTKELLEKLLELTQCDKIDWYRPVYYYDEGYVAKYDRSAWEVGEKFRESYLDITIYKTLWLWYRIVVEDVGSFWFPRWKDGPVKQIYELLEQRETDTYKLKKRDCECNIEQKLDSLMKLGCS